MATTRESVYASIEGICDIHTDLDKEQVLDIILARGTPTGSKFEDFVTITKDWKESEWKSVLREFYLSYQKAALCDVMFREIDPNMRPEPMIDAQKQITTFKKAPDNYYIHLVNLELEQPVEGESVADRELVLLSVFAAISAGENYGSVGYPPKAFITQVLGLEISQSDYYSTVVSEMQKPTSFEATVCALAKEHKDEVKAMKAAYKKLVGRDMEATVGKVAATASAAATVATVKAEAGVRKGKKFAGRVKEASYVPPEEGTPRKKRAKVTETDAVTEAKAQGAHIKTFAKWSIIMLIINGVATPTKLVLGITYIKMIASGGFFKMLAPSFFTIFTCFIPVAGCVCAGAMLFAGIVPGKDSRKKLAYIIMCLGLLCTAYSTLLLIKMAIAMITAWITKTFTLENIAQSSAEGLFGAVKGLGKGIANGVKSWFK